MATTLPTMGNPHVGIMKLVPAERFELPAAGLRIQALAAGLVSCGHSPTHMDTRTGLAPAFVRLQLTASLFGHRVISGWNGGTRTRYMSVTATGLDDFAFVPHRNGAPPQIRTGTERVLSALPLPLG